MGRSGRKRRELRIAGIVGTIVLAACKPDASPTSWPIQVNYIEGTPVDLAWLVLLKESQHSGNWQDGYTLEAVSDTLYTDTFGHSWIPINGLEGPHQLHIGTHNKPTSFTKTLGTFPFMMPLQLHFQLLSGSDALGAGTKWTSPITKEFSFGAVTIPGHLSPLHCTLSRPALAPHPLCFSPHSSTPMKRFL